MLDYWKLWIYDNETIKTVLSNNKIRQNFTSNEDGILKGIRGKYQNWKIQTLSLNCLQIAGSIHKYWNNGTNENDFSFTKTITAIKSFCEQFNLSPSLLYVKNLEFGVNLQLQINASEVIDQIICFNNLQPLRPYDIKTNSHFIEFEQWDYYLKVYDKGKQYKRQMPNTPNTLRIEVKGMNSRFLMSLNIETLEDLLKQKKFTRISVEIRQNSKRYSV